MGKISVAVLGATGMIGQRFIQLLEDHPYFEFGGLYASERSEGKRLSDVLKVRDYRFKDETLDMRIETLTNKGVSENCRIAFSGIPSEMAKETEAALAELGVAVFSNAGSHRMRPDVPVLIPEVNPEHIIAVKDQATYSHGGFIVTNANCSTTGIAPPLKALDQAYGLNFVSVSTYQALSGAGYPGVPSLDALGNVIPYIGGEEEKMETEIMKMLGDYRNGEFIYSSFTMLANCARVPVIDGHLESMVVKMEETPEPDEFARTLKEFKGPLQDLQLPTAPEHPIIVRTENNRPQPALDSFAGEPLRARGMSVTVGRIRRNEDYYKLFTLSHNTLRGGAGGSVINAELAVKRELI
ncbi:MAG: aspartate-semialdehyde dehydrogenase [Candidatus Methanomethylophilaceae archaeon]